MTARGLCRCGQPRAPGKKGCTGCLTAANAYNSRLKDAAYAAYGGYECACCGETTKEFLQLDHVNNDGAEHRRAIGGLTIYAWLKKANYPPGFQVLCANCNHAKGHYGECPHKRRKEAKRGRQQGSHF